MRDGHPYLTEVLDHKRAEQRRKLRSIPDWLVEKVDPSAWEIRDDALKGRDAPYAEVLVRRAADEQLADLEVLLSAWVVETDADRLMGFVQSDVTKDSHANFPTQAKADILRITKARRPASIVQDELPEEHKGPLAKALVLLAWADELAGDYIDPRLSRQTKRPVRP